MSILDPEGIAAARRKIHGAAQMANPNQGQNAQQIMNRPYSGIAAGPLVGVGGDPAYEAERKAEQDRHLRAQCLAIASQPHFNPADVMTNARQFYDFMKGTPKP